MIVLSYHRFVEQESEYRFSRTYDQFWHDIRKKQYDLITIDDAMECCIKAFDMMTELGIRGKLFVPVELVGQSGYCTWDQLKEIANFHDIENHGSNHIDHTKLRDIQIEESIVTASAIIKVHIGVPPKFFVAPYNQYDHRVERIAGSYNLTCLKDRVTILNISK
jgi:peptidoglycan/xylan/chitin deacetylase (PgdA/CDA1 family)